MLCSNQLSYIAIGFAIAASRELSGRQRGTSSNMALSLCDIIYIMRNQAARAGRHGRTPLMRSVNARRFREARHLCVLSQQAAADLLRVSLRTIKNWESGNVRVPYAAYKLMRILRGYQLPGESWRGWNLKGDVLWSPEGRAFRASDHGWWSLIVAKADAFDRWAEQRR